MKNLSKLYCIIEIITLAILVPALSLSWTGKIINIDDGDTITVLHDGKA
jgi:hypothetical protein